MGIDKIEKNLIFLSSFVEDLFSERCCFSEIFQGLISLEAALLIRDWEILYSLLKLFKCDLVVSTWAKFKSRVISRKQ